MVWIHEVTSIGEEKGLFYGTCRVLLDDKSLFCSETGKMRGSVAIELTGQAYGYSRACFHVVNDIDDTPKVTYMTGVRSCETYFNGFENNNETELKVEVQATRRIPPLTFIEGTVTGKDDTLYAKAEIQVYTV